MGAPDGVDRGGAVESTDEVHEASQLGEAGVAAGFGQIVADLEHLPRSEVAELTHRSALDAGEGVGAVVAADGVQVAGDARGPTRGGRQRLAGHVHVRVDQR